MSLNRCKKLTVMLLIVGLVLGLMGLAQAQPKSGFAPKVGYFMPGDKDVEDIWGSDFTFGIDYLYAFPPYGIEFGAEYFSKEKKEAFLGATAKQKWTVIPLTATFLYFLPGREGFSPYIGGGIGYYLAKYDLDVGWMGIPLFAESAEESGVGFHVQGGFTLGKSFFAEAKYSTADIENDISVNAGGFTILVGYRF
jgi:opacity protein-like surface antigen